MESLTGSYDLIITEEENDAVLASWTGFEDISYIKEQKLILDP